MRILFYQWEGYMQRDMELCLKNLNIDYDVCRHPFKKDSEALSTDMNNLLNSAHYDLVFSLNYREEVAKAAYEARVPYISWIYDSPFGISQDIRYMSLPTNYIFIFDGRDYENLKKRGVDTVYHLELAVNTSRLDKLLLSKADHDRFDADIAFVGKLYTSSFAGFKSRLDDEQSDFVEAVMEKQQAVQGEYMLDELTSDDEMLKSLQMTLEGKYNGYDYIFHESLQSLLAKEITKRDRLMLLLYLSEVYENVALYTNKSDPLLTNIDDRGLVESYEELFKVYKSTKINLNITFRRIATGIPLRALEIMGAGGFLMSNRQSELIERFRPGVDMVVYESLEDAAQKVQYYLTHDDERKEIAKNGHEAVKKYSYEAQVLRMIEIAGLSV